MIKINLATRKQAPSVEAGSGMTKASFEFTSILNFIKEEPVIRRAAIAVAVGIAAYAYANFEKTDRIEKLDVQLEAAKNKTQALATEVKQKDDREKQKDELEKIRKQVATKVTTMTELTATRQRTPKVLRFFSTALPEETWLTQLRIRGSEILLQGMTREVTRVSDVVKAFQESQYFTDAKMVGTSSTKDEKGNPSTRFEITAKFREN